MAHNESLSYDGVYMKDDKNDFLYFLFYWLYSASSLYKEPQISFIKEFIYIELGQLPMLNIFYDTLMVDLFTEYM